MIKYGKNSFMKGPFPFLSKWFYNFVGSSKIGKGTVIEESVMNDKFINVGENCYIGVNSTLASHLLQGVFGNISYFKIKVGDNATAAAMSQIGPGSEINDDAFLLPLASVSKHSVIKGDKNFYFGIPMRKIFKRKIMDYLKISPEDIERNKNLNLIKTEKKPKNIKSQESVEVEDNKSEDKKLDLPVLDDYTEKDLALDFATSSAISRINIKFLIVYIPIFWLSGLLVAIFWYWFTSDPGWLAILLFLPFALFGMVYFFILGCLLFTKLFLILVNLIHKPKEGIFIAEITRGNRNTDYEFWMLRTELKKIGLWLMRNSPLPWTDAFAFKIYGLNMDYSSHLNDSWCDSDFIKFGRKVLIGQGATIMSSMVVGKYLILKDVVFEDYAMVGGHTTIAPGTIMGKESVIGALSSTTYNQVLEPGWVYFGFPAIKLKENKYAEERRDVIIKRDVDEAKKFETTHEVNIDEDKKELVKTQDNNK
jgi:acetyltransferase-like isoleucine patch superfamily enzyme